MDEHTLVLRIPDDLFHRVQQAASESNRPVETMLVESLALLFGDLPDSNGAILASVETLSDEELWAIVHRPLAWAQEVRLKELTARSKHGGLSEVEIAEMNHLIDQVDQYVLLRSHALLLLKQRGHDVEVLA